MIDTAALREPSSVADSSASPIPLPRGVADVRRLVAPPVVDPVGGNGATGARTPAIAVEGSLALDLWGAAEFESEPREIPDVEPWARRFSQAVVEAVGGVRPVTQLVRWTSRRVYADLERRVRLVAEARGAGRATSLVRPQVRSVHVSHPTYGVAEIAVHVGHGHRSRAMAARLEFRRGVWCCTALEIG